VCGRSSTVIAWPLAHRQTAIAGDVMLLEGASGTIRLDGDGRLFHRAFGDNQEHQIAYAWADVGFAGDSVLRLQRHVVDHLQGRGPLHNSARVYLANLRIEEAVYASSAAGRLQPVRLEGGHDALAGIKRS
jgi:hypothetical protein